MSREIKFRAISHYSNQFEHGDLNLIPSIMIAKF